MVRDTVSLYNLIAENHPWCVCVCVCVCTLSYVWLFMTPWTVAPQAHLSMGFPKQEYWSGLPFPSPGDLPNPGIKPASLYLCIGRQILYHWATWEAYHPWMWEQFRRLLEMGQTIRHVLFVWQDWRKVSNSLHQGCCIAKWISYICIYIPPTPLSFGFPSRLDHQRALNNTVDFH